MKIPTSRRTALLALIGAGTLWGLGFVFGKIALAEMPVGTMIAYRFAIATAVLLPVLFFRRGFSPQRRDFVWIVIAGVLFVPVQFILQFEGLARTSVSHASLMVATVPALLAIVTTIVTRKAPHARTSAAVVASVLGAALVAANMSNGASLRGDILVLTSLLAAVAWITITDRRLGSYDAISATAAMLAVGTAVLIAFESVVHGRDLVAAYSLRTWMAVIASGVLCTAVSTMLWNIGLQAVEATQAGVFINLEPVVGAACGVVFFGDALGWQLLAGAAIVLASALTITLSTADAKGHLALPAEYGGSYDDGERGVEGSTHAKSSAALGFGARHLRRLQRAPWVAAHFRAEQPRSAVDDCNIHSTAGDPVQE